MKQLDNLGAEDFQPLGEPIRSTTVTHGKRKDITPDGRVQECLDGPNKGKWVTNAPPPPKAPATPAVDWWRMFGQGVGGKP